MMDVSNDGCDDRLMMDVKIQDMGDYGKLT